MISVVDNSESIALAKVELAVMKKAVERIKAFDLLSDEKETAIKYLVEKVQYPYGFSSSFDELEGKASATFDIGEYYSVKRIVLSVLKDNLSNPDVLKIVDKDSWTKKESGALFCLVSCNGLNYLLRGGYDLSRKDWNDRCSVWRIADKEDLEEFKTELTAFLSMQNLSLKDFEIKERGD